MIIDDFDVKGIAVMPFKADSPLFVDANEEHALVSLARTAWIGRASRHHTAHPLPDKLARSGGPIDRHNLQ